MRNQVEDNKSQSRNKMIRRGNQKGTRIVRKETVALPKDGDEAGVDEVEVEGEGQDVDEDEDRGKG